MKELRNVLIDMINCRDYNGSNDLNTWIEELQDISSVLGKWTGDITLDDIKQKKYGLIELCLLEPWVKGDDIGKILEAKNKEINKR